MSAVHHHHSGTVAVSAPQPRPPAIDPRAAATAAHLKAREHPDYALDRELTAAFYATIADVAKDSRTRSLEGAKYIQIAAGAIGTLYTGALALTFSATDAPLPIRGLLTPTFLGLSIVLSAVYLGFISANSSKLSGPAPSISLEHAAELRANYLVKWVNRSVRRRAWAMRSAVLALGFGLAFLPAPFVSGGGTTATTPAAPTIPISIPAAIEETAVEVFEKQAASFTDAAPKVAEAKPCSKDFIFELFWRCGWRGESGVNQRFLNLFLVALALTALPAGLALLSSAKLIPERFQQQRSLYKELKKARSELDVTRTRLKELQTARPVQQVASQPEIKGPGGSTKSPGG